MNNAELHILLDEKFLSGGRRTTAQFARDFLNENIDSFLNPEDFFTGASSQYVAADGSFQTASASSLFKGEWVSGTYKDGDSVLHSSLLWEANQDNTGEEPGTGASWDLQITNDDAYGFGYTGSQLGVTQNRFYQVIEDLKTSNDSIYLRLDGLYPTTGDINLGGNYIKNIAGLKNGSSTLVFDITNDIIYDKSGVESVDLDIRAFKDASNVYSFAYGLRRFLDSGGNTSFDYETRKGYDFTGSKVTFNYGAGTWYDASETQSGNWMSRILNGDWSIDSNFSISDTSKYFYWGIINNPGSARISYDSILFKFVFERWDTITSTYILIQSLS